MAEAEDLRRRADQAYREIGGQIERVKELVRQYRILLDGLDQAAVGRRPHSRSSRASIRPPGSRERGG